MSNSITNACFEDDVVDLTVTNSNKRKKTTKNEVNSSSTTSTFKYTIHSERMKRVEPTKMIDGVSMYW